MTSTPKKKRPTPTPTLTLTVKTKAKKTTTKTTKKTTRKKSATSTATTPSRGPLRPMRVSHGFREFVLDQLSGIRDLRARQMFGGIGLYAGDVFFGIVASDVLYFKVDDTNRRDYEQAGASPFKPYADRPMTMSYYGVPIAVLEDAERLGDWAARAVAVAVASKRATPEKRSPVTHTKKSGARARHRS